MTEEIIASPSRDKDGNITTPAAKYVGDREAIVKHTATQLVSQAAARGETLDDAAALDEAKKEMQDVESKANYETAESTGTPSSARSEAPEASSIETSKS